MDVLRKRVYFLGGRLPRWFDVDGMLTQRAIKRQNREGIHRYSDPARKILEIFKRDLGAVMLPYEGLISTFLSARDTKQQFYLETIYFEAM